MLQMACKCKIIDETLTFSSRLYWSGFLALPLKDGLLVPVICIAFFKMVKWEGRAGMEGLCERS